MILVTGASGLVGSQIIRYLLSTNKDVRAIKRKTSNLEWTSDINEFIDWIETDILDIIKLDNAFVGITHVVHCAAIVSFDNSNNEQMHTVNIEGTKNILALCQKYNVQKLIYLSSIAALGRSSKSDEITEEAKWESSTTNSSYGTSKYLAEIEVWRAQEEGLTTLILNPSVIIGPGNWTSSSVKFFKHVKTGNPLYPIGSLNYVDARDVAKIVGLFLYNNIPAERFILNAGTVSYKDFFGLIARAMNKKAPFLKISTSLAIFVAGVLNLVKIFTGIKTNITKEAVLLSLSSKIYSAAKVEKALDYNFKSLDDSIKWTVEQLENKASNS